MKSAMFSRILFALAALVLVGTGCKKLKNTTSGTDVTVSPNQTLPQTGGKGGTASLNITPNHDGLNIDSCKLYIKYDASVVPRNGIYDDSVWAVQKNGSPVATFSGLKAGNYYLFAKGWDLIRSEKVRGGLPFTIITDNESTNHYLTLPIQDYQ